MLEHVFRFFFPQIVQKITRSFKVFLCFFFSKKHLKSLPIPFFLILVIFIASPLELHGQLNPDSPDKPTFVESLLLSPNPYEQVDYMNLHQQLKILGFLTLLTFIPFVLIMMTSFTRITIIFHFLRQAIATQQVPSNQLLIGMSLILTGFIMHPVIEEIHTNALMPYMKGTMKDYPEIRTGVKGEDQLFFENSWKPLRSFMLAHTREKDMQLFLDLGNIKLPAYEGNKEEIGYVPPTDTGPAYDLATIPWYCIVPAFVISELRNGFVMGFLLFLPFLVIDMVIASVLMSMGMMMLPPVMISMPFKLLLFILVDGWSLVVQQTVKSFHSMG